MKKFLAYTLVAIASIALINDANSQTLECNSNLSPSDRLYRFIKSKESFSPSSYDDNTQKSIGYGSSVDKVQSLLRYKDSNEEVNVIEATIVLMKDVEFFSNVVKESVTSCLNQNQFDALVSFTYNVGPNAFKRSSLLKSVNSRKFNNVPTEMMRWVHVNNQVNLGLKSRRRAEVNMWNGS